MKAIINSIDIISESNCDIGFTILDDSAKVLISDKVNIRNIEQDHDAILEHIRKVLTEIRDKFVVQKESKLSEEVLTLLNAEIDIK